MQCKSALRERHMWAQQGDFKVSGIMSKGYPWCDCGWARDFGGGTIYVATQFQPYYNVEHPRHKSCIRLSSLK